NNNDETIKQPEMVQFKYMVTSTAGEINTKTLDRIGVHINDHPRAADHYYNLSKDEVEAIRNLGNDIQVSYVTPSHMDDALYPHRDDLFPDWTTDQYGPLHIPAKGVSVELTPLILVTY